MSEYNEGIDMGFPGIGPRISRVWFSISRVVPISHVEMNTLGTIIFISGKMYFRLGGEISSDDSERGCPMRGEYCYALRKMKVKTNLAVCHGIACSPHLF